MNVLDFPRFKKEGNKITMVTSYDFWSASILAETDVDVLLVGDSLSMVIYGHGSTLPATTEMMVRHVESVAKGAPGKFIVADMPFLTFRKGEVAALECVEALMRAGAHAVKLEGVYGHEDVITHIVQSGVPVMGHLGLTPQSIHQFGGFKVQGKKRAEQDSIVEQAKLLEECGCFSLVLECIPAHLAKTITESVGIATIGIGAGIDVDGQVLVLQDLLGMNRAFRPRFVRQYLNGSTVMAEAVTHYIQDVKKGRFPSEEESYGSDTRS